MAIRFAILEIKKNDMNAIYHSFVVEVDPPKVFAAITEPEHLIQWWPKRCSGIAEIGAEYNFFFEEPYNWFAKVSEIKVNESIALKMTKSDPDWDPTTFGFDLKDHKKGTYVSFYHKDWPDQNEHMKYSSFCWAMLLNGLKDYLEKGKVIPFEERD